MYLYKLQKKQSCKFFAHSFKKGGNVEERKLLNEMCRIHRILGNLFALKVLRAISRAGRAGISLTSLKAEFGHESNFIPGIIRVFVSAGLVREEEGVKGFRITGLGCLFADKLPVLMERAGFRRA